MAKKHFKAKLDTNDISRIIGRLDQYNIMLQAKCEQLVEALADIGIQTARWNLLSLVNDTHGTRMQISDKVSFSKELEVEQDGATCIIIPASTQFVNAWATGVAIVDPLLMAEFGSGMYAIEGHRGTFPMQTHAFDPNGWYWRDMNGTMHHSYGIPPTRPLYKAVEEMKQKITDVATQVFST